MGLVLSRDRQIDRFRELVLGSFMIYLELNILWLQLLAKNLARLICLISEVQPELPGQNSIGLVA